MKNLHFREVFKTCTNKIFLLRFENVKKVFVSIYPSASIYPLTTLDILNNNPKTMFNSFPLNHITA